jgi:hypothetical protein
MPLFAETSKATAFGQPYLKTRAAAQDIFVTRFDSPIKPVDSLCSGEGNQEVSAIYTDSYLCSYVTENLAAQCSLAISQFKAAEPGFNVAKG